MQKTQFEKSFNDLIRTTKNDIILSIINKAASSCCDRTWDRISLILKYTLAQDINNLKKECYLGLPDDLASLRSFVWCLNFNYLPNEPNKWIKTLEKKRLEYLSIKEALGLRLKAEIQIFEDYKRVINDKNSTQNEIKNIKELTETTDRQLLELIDKDVNRTHSNICFFSMPVNAETIFTDEQLLNMVTRKRDCIYSDPKQVYTKGFEDISQLKQTETHSDVLGRILYIFAKLNKDINYVQGMNEILAPIYYCLATDLSFSETYENVEADAYWCFTCLMNKIKVTFIAQYDLDGSGIFRKSEIMEKIISKYAKKVYIHFKKVNIQIAHFAFKWFNLFFSQELVMPDILRLWDTFFCEEDKFYFVYYFSLAYIKIHENELLKMDFPNIMKFFQEFEGGEIEKIIELGIKIKNSNEKKIKAIIYEDIKNKDMAEKKTETQSAKNK